MVSVPENPKSFAERLGEWYDLKDELSELRSREMLVRKALFDEAFPTPHEGVNVYPLGGGFELRARLDYDRTIDIAQLGFMRDAFKNIEQSIDPLIRWKAELNVKPYKALPAEARALFDNIVTTKPGTPQFSIEPAKDLEDYKLEPVNNPPPEIEVPNDPPAKKRGRRTKAKA